MADGGRLYSGPLRRGRVSKVDHYPIDKCHGSKLYYLRLPQRHIPSPAQAPNDFVIQHFTSPTFLPHSAMQGGKLAFATRIDNYGDVVGLSGTSDYRLGRRG